jgi:hypothetical protein
MEPRSGSNGVKAPTENLSCVRRSRVPTIGPGAEAGVNSPNLKFQANRAGGAEKMSEWIQRN